MPLNPSNTLRAVRVPSANGGRSRPAGSVPTAAASAGQHRSTPPKSAAAGHGSTAALSASEATWFDKYHKLLEEHMRIKQERKEQEQRLTDITTKFRKVTRDLKLSGFDSGEASTAADEILQPYQREIRELKERLQQVTAERDSARADAAELRKLMGMRPAGSMTGSSSGGGGGRHASSAAAAGIVDVSSLVNRKQSLGGSGHPSSSSSSSDDVLKLRVALNEEIVKNDRLSQHCENLRAQLAVAAAASSMSASNNNNQQYHNNGMNRSPARQQSPVRGVGVQSSSTVSTGAYQNVSSNSNAAEISQLNARLIEYKAALDASQRDKVEVERQLHEAKMRLASSQQQQQPSGGASSSAFMMSGSTPQQQYGTPNLRGGSGVVSAAAAAGPASTSSYAAAAADHAAHSALQHINTDLTAQVASLAQRLDFSNGQVQTLRAECERLLNEIKRAHGDVADARRETFEAQQRLSATQVKAGRVDELEASLQSKTEDYRRCEQELYQLVDRLKTCNRETESQVRSEFQGRLRDAETLRDEAEAARRMRERELSSVTQDLASCRRDVRSKDSEIEHLTAELHKARRQNDELQHKAQTQRFASQRDASDAHLVQEAVASVMSSNQALHHPHPHHHHTAAAAATAGGSMSATPLFDGATSSWNEKWELQQIREQAAAAILDRETAEQRASDFELAVRRKSELLETVMEERDQLLAENLELRRRLSGVQTCFTRTLEESSMIKQQLDNSTMMMAGGGALVASSSSASPPHRSASITVTLSGIFLKGFSGLHIASLEGVAGFECGVSDPFAVLGDGTPTGPSIEVPFRFSHISLDDEHTLHALRDAFFSLQLHQVRDGSKAALVAIARVPVGASVAACLETGNTCSRIELLGGDGSVVGGSTFVTSVDNAALPLALLPPIDAKASAAVKLGFATASADPDAMRSLLLRMRAVRGVRIQILRCNGLYNGADPNRVLTPYVFYTTTLEQRAGRIAAGGGGAGDWPLAHIISDTAVHTRTRAVTNDPVFDVEPKDFTFRVFDPQVAAFFRHAMLSFVVYDVNCERPEEHVGMVSVPLAGLLESPSVSLIKNDVPLDPRGTISFTVSWIK